MSQFDQTAEQDALRRSVRSFFTRFDREYVRECDRTPRPPVEAFTAMGDLGWLGINCPEQYGGGGGSATDVAVLLEELGAGFLDLALWVFRVLSHGVHALDGYGTEEQKQRFLPDIAAGRLSVCFALTEPEAGSDAAALTTTARRSGDGWEISGQKVFCSGFKVSDYVMVATRTSKGDRKQAGITTFFVPTTTPGLEARPLEMLGHRPLGTTLLTFDGAHVPDDLRIGPVDGGWAILTKMLEYERLCLSAARTGAAQSVLDDTLDYVKQRKQFGQPIGNFQAVAHKLADMAVLVEVARTQVYRYAHRLDAGTADTRDAAILKLVAGEAYKKVADLGVQAMGGYGYSMEYDAQRHFRDSRLGTIGGGSSEIQRNIIARTLGLRPS
ncbi:acyl-CoA dehydrogenase family protein [Mycolicibacterium sp.]|uniref:acyl-CoA dehydrogenase family protein n=1 Tax=Mycolicibacterium sp. TaxID=2320850 RepID=UPI003D0E2894